MGRKSKKQLAREANTSSMGRQADEIETSGSRVTYNGKNKLMPKSHRDFNTVLTHLNHNLELLHKNPPPGVSLVHVTAFEKLMSYAFREPIENVEMVKCTNPDCRKMHLIECPHCETSHSIVIPSAVHEKNSIVALNKLIDKLAPNLAAVSQDINITGLQSSITDWGVRIITKYVPVADQPMEVQKLNQALTNAVEAEFTEVSNVKS